MDKILSFPNQQQSLAKKFVKEGPGALKEIDATMDLTSLFMIPFEGYCQKDYHLRDIFNILALALFDPDWIPLKDENGNAPPGHKPFSTFMQFRSDNLG